MRGASIIISFVAVFSSASGSALAQATFQNLGFESAQVTNQPPYTPTLLPFPDVFPGWTGYIGTNQATQAFLNGVSAGGALITLISTNTGGFGDRVIEGNYTATLSAGVVTTNGLPAGIVSAALAQTSLIPVLTRSLRFSASPLYPGSIDDLAVTIGGQAVTFFALMTNSNSVEYGADVTTFAGQTTELRFNEQPITRNDATIFLDKISFSNIPVPEPSTSSITMLMASLFLLRRGRTSR